jgi:hypothetical protein
MMAKAFTQSTINKFDERQRYFVTFPKKVMVVCRRRWLFCGAVVVFAFAMTRR